MDDELRKKYRLHRFLLRLPTLLQRSALLGMTFLVLITFLMTNIYALLWQSSDWLVGAVLPGVVAHLTNVERVNAAVGELTRNPLLDQAARLKAEHMAAEGYFAHNSPGGITPWYWFDQVGYVYAHAGENLAVHFNDSEEVVKAWMNSPTHRDNIVAGKYTEIGIGTAKGRYQGFDTVFVVQMFGTPAKPVAAPAPLPATPQPVTSPVIVESVAAATPSAEVITRTTAPAAPVVLAEETTVADNAVAAVETNPVVTDVIPSDSSPVEDIEVVSNPYVISDLSSEIATTSGLEPDFSASEFSAGTTAPQIAILATQPYRILQLLYIGIGSVVFLLLTLSIIFGWHRNNNRAILYGVALLILMSLLFALHVYATRGVFIV
jgi:hypothetical protein